MLHAKDTKLIKFSALRRSSQSNGDINIANRKKKKRQHIAVVVSGITVPQRCPHVSPVPGNLCHSSTSSSGRSLLLGALPTPSFLCVHHRNGAFTTVRETAYLPICLFHLYVNYIFVFSLFLMLWHLGLAEPGRDCLSQGLLILRTENYSPASAPFKSKQPI